MVSMPYLTDLCCLVSIFMLVFEIAIFAFSCSCIYFLRCTFMILQSIIFALCHIIDPHFQLCNNLIYTVVFRLSLFVLIYMHIKPVYFVTL